MADSPTYFSTIATDAVNAWIASEMYTLSERQLVLGQYAKKYTLPERMSKTMRIIRFKRLNNPLAPLTEGTPPDAIALSLENVDVQVEQWGLIALLTDVAEVTTTHPALQIAIERVSRSMSEVIEREIATVLMGGSQVQFGSTSGTPAANRIGLTGAYYLATGDVLRAVSQLRSNGAMDFEGGLYVGCMSPQVEADMIGDTTFSNAASYSQVVRLNVGEIGTWAGVRWVRSNFLPIFKGVGAPGTQTTVVSGYTAGSSTGFGSSSVVTVVSRDAQSGYERRVSAAKTLDDDSSVTITTPTSTNYVYDIYLDDQGTGVYKLVYASVPANTAKVLTVTTTYAAGVVKTPPAVPYTTQEVFISWIFGKEAFGRVELSGMSLQSYLTPPTASFANPLAQGRKIGAKVMWKSFIIDNNFFVRLESNSRYSANLPA